MQLEFLVVSGAVAFLIAWAIGAQDVSNALGTSVGSKALTVRQAVLVGAVCEFLGSLMGGEVAGTISGGILEPAAFTGPGGTEVYARLMLSTMVGAFAWLAVATRYALPVSSTHSLVGALVGVGVVAKSWSAIQLGSLAMLVSSWVTSPLLGGVVSFGIFRVIYRRVLRAPNPGQAAAELLPQLTGVTLGTLVMFLALSGPRSYRLSLAHATAAGVAVGAAITLGMRAHASAGRAGPCGLASRRPALRRLLVRLGLAAKEKGTPRALPLSVRPPRPPRADRGSPPPLPSPAPPATSQRTGAWGGHPDLYFNNGASALSGSLTPPVPRARLGAPPAQSAGSGDDAAGRGYAFAHAPTAGPAGLLAGLHASSSASSLEGQRGYGSAASPTAGDGACAGAWAPAASPPYSIAGMDGALVSATAAAAAAAAAAATSAVVTPGAIGKAEPRRGTKNRGGAGGEDGEDFSATANGVAQRLARAERAFLPLMVLTACVVSFAHGSNDVSNSVGPFTAIASIYATGAVASGGAPLWVLVAGGVGIVLGLATYGHHVMATVGEKITKLSFSRGFAAQIGTACTVLSATQLGLSVSTTHSLIGAISGVALVEGGGQLNVRTLRRIVVSWVVTIPAAALFSIVVYGAMAVALPLRDAVTPPSGVSGGAAAA